MPSLYPTRTKRKASMRFVRSAVDRPLMMVVEHNKFDGTATQEIITQKTCAPIFDANVLETFSLTDLVDLAMLARPWPDEQDIPISPDQSDAQGIREEVEEIAARVRCDPRFKPLIEVFFSEQPSPPYWGIYLNAFAEL